MDYDEYTVANVGGKRETCPWHHPSEGGTTSLINPFLLLFIFFFKKKNLVSPMMGKDWQVQWRAHWVTIGDALLLPGCNSELHWADPLLSSFDATQSSIENILGAIPEAIVVMWQQLLNSNYVQIKGDGGQQTRMCPGKREPRNSIASSYCHKIRWWLQLHTFMEDKSINGY